MENGKKTKSALANLRKAYREKREEIQKRLMDFRRVWQHGSDEVIFSELTFCICAIQNKAELSDDAVHTLLSNGTLFHGSQSEIAEILRSKVRFHNQKSLYIVETRKYFSEKSHLRVKDVLNRFLNEKIPYNHLTIQPFHQTLRDWLAENPGVMGLGYKESSHFLRNIGLGEGLAILDRHILTNLIRFRVIPEMPKSLTKKRYLEIEKKIRKFSQRVEIPMADLDLLFWSFETGKIFK